MVLKVDASMVKNGFSKADGASQLGLVYFADYTTGMTIPNDAMRDNLAIWHNGQFYSIGTDTGFTSNDFDADLSAGRFVSANLTTQVQQWRDECDLRGWIDLIDGLDITDPLNEILATKNKLVIDATGMNFVVSGRVSVSNSNTAVYMKGDCRIKQTAVNTPVFTSGESVLNVTYSRPKLDGFGRGDTASTYNSDNGTSAAQAYGIEFKGSTGLVTTFADIKGFKNCGIRAEYATNVWHYKSDIEGTHPDADIPDGDTSRQQFGILTYASTYAVKNATAQEIKEGTATPHGNKNIRIESPRIGNTAIGICVFPGFNNVEIISPVTHGKFSQHSIYAYPGNGLYIQDYNLNPEQQYVGIKISNNVLANRLIPKNIFIGKGVISNNLAPAISVESFDKFDDGSFDVQKSGSFFNDLYIDDVTINNYSDIGLSLACCYGQVRRVTLNNQLSTTSTRNPLDLRSFGGLIENVIINGTSRGAVGGVGVLNKATTFDTCRFIDAARNFSAFYLSLAPAVTPMEIKSQRWYAMGSLVYNPATDEVFNTTKSGFTNSTLPAGAGDHVSGTAGFRYFGLYADLKTKVNLYDNIYDVEGGTLATKSVSLNNPKFQVKVRGDWAQQSIVGTQIQGQIDMWQGTNLANSSKVATTTPNYNGVGEGGNVYYGGNSSGPTVGAYEVGDIYNVVKSGMVTGDTSKLKCVTRGSVGTWKIVEKVQ